MIIFVSQIFRCHESPTFSYPIRKSKGELEARKEISFNFLHFVETPHTLPDDFVEDPGMSVGCGEAGSVLGGYHGIESCRYGSDCCQDWSANCGH